MCIRDRSDGTRMLPHECCVIKPDTSGGAHSASLSDQLIRYFCCNFYSYTESFFYNGRRIKMKICSNVNALNMYADKPMQKTSRAHSMEAVSYTHLDVYKRQV